MTKKTVVKKKKIVIEMTGKDAERALKEMMSFIEYDGLDAKVKEVKDK